MKARVGILLALFIIGGCQQNEPKSENVEPVIRGLRTIVVKEQEQTTVRLFPSVLQPAEITTLSFETPGRIGPINLKVGQKVSKGEKVAELDSKSLEIQVENAQAGVEVAKSNANNAKQDFARQKTLFDKKVINNAKLDQSRNVMETSKAQLAQALKQVEAAKENLGKATLTIPFDGLVNSVVVESFSNVGAGNPVATLYGTDGFESNFSVSYEVISNIAIGKKVRVRLADNPKVLLDGTVSELGSRADAVASFPIVVALDAKDANLKAGMAVEVSIEIPIAAGTGFVLPLSVLPMFGQLTAPDGSLETAQSQIFVFDPTTTTVKKRTITVEGIRENKIIVVDGLSVGDRVASAGVSFLREGQRVKLLSENK